VLSDELLELELSDSDFFVVGHDDSADLVVWVFFVLDVRFVSSEDLVDSVDSVVGHDDAVDSVSREKRLGGVRSRLDPQRLGLTQRTLLKHSEVKQTVISRDK